MSKALTIVATLKAKPGREDALASVLKGLLAPTQAEDGCIVYDMHRSDDDPGSFVFTETWASRPLWEAHMASPHLAAFSARRDELVERWDLFVGHKV